jgi:hypothetical protein
VALATVVTALYRREFSYLLSLFCDSVLLPAVRETVIVLDYEPEFVVLDPALPPRDVSVFLTPE